MDVSMRNVDGVTAIRWLKSHPRTCAIPLILLPGTRPRPSSKAASKLAF